MRSSPGCASGNARGMLPQRTLPGSAPAYAHASALMAALHVLVESLSRTSTKAAPRLCVLPLSRYAKTMTYKVRRNSSTIVFPKSAADEAARLYPDSELRAPAESKDFRSGAGLAFP
jgi:hypothetical protein